MQLAAASAVSYYVGVRFLGLAAGVLESVPSGKVCPSDRAVFAS